MAQTVISWSHDAPAPTYRRTEPASMSLFAEGRP